MKKKLKCINKKCKLIKFYCWKCKTLFYIQKCKVKVITFDNSIVYSKAQCPNCNNLIIKFDKRIDKTI